MIVPLTLAVTAFAPVPGDDPLLRYMQCPSDVSRSLLSSGQPAERIADEGLSRCEPLIGNALDHLEASARKDPATVRRRASESEETRVSRRRILAGKVRKAARESAVTAVVEMRAWIKRR